MMNDTDKWRFPYWRLPMRSADILWFYGIEVTVSNHARAVRNLAVKHDWEIIQLSNGKWVQHHE